MYQIISIAKKAIVGFYSNFKYIKKDFICKIVNLVRK